ncbi:sodium:proton antiporter [Nocardioides sp. zg-1230]|nr:cation:proton antiporter [Nocardioides sp. zg-1230]NPC42870.1 sodium:proton antiporter [Nocardioides sp. zg-1230]
MLLVCFAALLVVGVLLSELANRTVLSTAVLFLVGGFVLGPGVLGVLDVQSGDPAVSVLAELALFSVLFSDGMRVGVDELRAAWRLPGRALVLGLPLTLLVTAALGHWVAGLPWLESLLLGAVLSPTDPVFAAAIVGRREVPGRLRHLLNVESGVNDGLALPVVLVLLAAAGGTDTSGWALAEELALGIVIGVGVPWVVLRLERLPFLASVTHLQPLLPAALGLLVLGLCLSTHANLFLGAFAAGATVATMSDELRHEFEQLGELVAEQLKLAAVLLFAALMTPTFLLEEISWTGWAFAVLALVVARPLALWVAFLGSGLGRREQAAAMWFGPKGFASVVYGLIVLESGIGLADELFHLTALTVSLSILAHSSTDVVVARQFVTDDVDSR